MQSDNPMRFFSENVDNWGAVEWFDRAAKAIRSQDKAIVEGDEIAAETYRMIAASSLMTLVRDHEATVRTALEAALSAAEPVMYVSRNGSSCSPAFYESLVDRSRKNWQPLFAAPLALSAQVQDVAEGQPKEISTWEDQQAFEAWAQGERYEMHQHPLHYLFMDPKTNAARQGWKAALQFIRDRSAAAPAKQEGDE